MILPAHMRANGPGWPPPPSLSPLETGGKILAEFKLLDAYSYVPFSCLPQPPRERIHLSPSTASPAHLYDSTSHDGLTYLPDLPTVYFPLFISVSPAICPVPGTQGGLRMNEYGGGRLSGAVYVSHYYPAPNSTEGLGEQSRGVRWN